MGRQGKSKRIAGRVALGALALALVVAILLGLPGGSLAWANRGPSESTGGHSVTVFEDRTIAPGETYQNVVIVGGDVRVEGTVTHGIVAVGGSVTLAPTARVGTHVTAGDATVVCIFGEVITETGALVIGETTSVVGGLSKAGRALVGAAGYPFVSSWHSRWVDWLGLLTGMVVAALLIGAIAPRQLVAVRDRVQHHFWSSLGWGALGALVLIPVVSVLLVVTLIGIVLLEPGLAVAVPLMFVFGFAAVGAWLGALILGRRRYAGNVSRERVITSAVLGVAVVSLLVWVPIVGALVFGVLWLVGLGAVMTALGSWWRGRRRSRRMAASVPPPSGAGGPAAPPACGPTWPEPTGVPGS